MRRNPGRFGILRQLWSHPLLRDERIRHESTLKAQAGKQLPAAGVGRIANMLPLRLMILFAQAEKPLGYIFQPGHRSWDGERRLGPGEFERRDRTGRGAVSTLRVRPKVPGDVPTPAGSFEAGHRIRIDRRPPELHTCSEIHRLSYNTWGTEIIITFLNSQNPTRMSARER